MLTRRIKLQLVVFGVVALAAGSIMAFGYIKVPAMLGIGQYTVVVELPQAAGLYATANVSYRGTTVGKVTDVRLTEDGRVEAVMALQSGTDIPSDLTAEVHSTSAIGEQYVALVPRTADAPPLKNGDVIPVARATTPPRSTRCSTRRTGASRRSRGQRQDRHRRKLRRGRRSGSAVVAHRPGLDAVGLRCTREPRLRPDADRRCQTVDGFAGADGRFDQRLGFSPC